jgi:hypothetical protein
MTRISVCALAVVASACASGGGTPAPQQAPAPNGVIVTPGVTEVPVNRDRDLITQQELQAPAYASMTALDVIRALRPQFLTERGKNTAPAKNGNDPNGAALNDGEAGKVHVSIDGNRIGLLEDLAGIQANTVKEIRFLNIAQAHQRFGTAAREGPVILLTRL